MCLGKLCRFFGGGNQGLGGGGPEDVSPNPSAATALSLLTGLFGLPCSGANIPEQPENDGSPRMLFFAEKLTLL